ncbi:MAG TPA: DUF58 domain-containing protein [Syntrophorhabdaceae bacterium]|nr:DUF58 domain-containing protein [Syntrophorhabdaceae bacterium]
MGISAVNTGNNLIYLIVSALLGFMGISGYFGKNNLSKIYVFIEFPQEIYANTSFPVKIIIKNKKRLLPIFLLRLHIAGHSVLFPYADAKSEITKYINIIIPERGQHTIRDIYISSVFPFNFFTRFRHIEDTFDCIAFPELKKCELISLYEKERLLRGEKTSDKAGFESDIVSIREYVYGDPLKYINWKATAKTGALKTKELSSLLYQPIIIDFDKIAIKDIEEKISCISYSIVQLLKKNSPVGLKIKDKMFEPGNSRNHKMGMLKGLAFYEKNK